MKKFVQGYCGRALTMLALVAMLVPGLLLPVVKAGRAAVDDGRGAKVLLLPVAAEADGVPAGLAGQATAQLKYALGLRGVEAIELSRNSGILALAQKRMADEDAQKSLLENYDIAMNPKAGDEARARAAAVLVAAVSVDGAVLAKIRGYQLTRDGSQREILLNASVVMLEVDEKGKPAVDDQGNAKSSRSLYSASGKSQALPGRKVTGDLIDKEAIASAADSLATKITRQSAGSPPVIVDPGKATVAAATPGQSDAKKNTRSMWPLLAVIGLAAVALGNGGNNGGTPEPPPGPVIAAPINLVTQALLNGSALEIKLTWSMPAGADLPTSFAIYRTVGTTSSAMLPGTRSLVAADPHLRKGADGRISPVPGAEARGAGSGWRSIHAPTAPQALPALPTGTPYYTLNTNGVGLALYTFIDTDVDYGNSYTYEVYAIYSTGASSTPATSTKTMGSRTPEVIDLAAANEAGTIRLTWTSPTGMTAGKFRVFRSTDSTKMVGVDQVGYDELAGMGFTEITPRAGLAWSASSTYLDKTATMDQLTYYCVVWYTTAGVHSTGPYMIVSATPTNNLQILTLDVKSSTAITATWLDDTFADTYRLQRSLTPDIELSWSTVDESGNLTYDDTELTPGTRYYYRLYKQSAGWVAYGDVVSASTFPDAPKWTKGYPKPISYQRCDLSWTTVSGATYYIIQREDESETEFTTIDTVAAGSLSLPYHDDTVAPGSTVKYRVIASNDLTHNGEDDLPGTPTDEATALNYPGPVTDLTTPTIGPNELDLSWTASVDDTFTTQPNYKIERTTDTSKWPLLPIVASQAETTYANTGLATSTNYYYRITAFNATGGTVSQVFGPFTTYPRPVQITVPVELLSSTSVKVSWITSFGSTKYTLMRRLAAEDNLTPVTTVDNPDGTAGIVQSATDTGLLTGQSYVYQLMTSNLASGDGSLSDEVTISTLFAPVVTEPLTVIGENEIDLSWKAVAGATSYWVMRSTDGTTWPDTQTVTGLTTTSYKDTGLGKGTKHYYRVVARVDATGEIGVSDPSKIVSAQTYPGTSTLTATAVSGTQVDLSWTAVPNTVKYILEKKNIITDVWEIFGTYDNATFGVSDKGCGPGNQYTYRITASLSTQLTDGEVSAEAVAFTKLEKPTISSIEAVTDSQVKLTWGKVTGATGYRIERSVSGANGPWTLAKEDAADASTTYTEPDKALTGSTTYWYRVTALIQNMTESNSDPSDSVSVTTLAGPKASQYVITLATGKPRRLYFSDASAETLALLAETKTDLVLTAYENETRTTVAKKAVVSVFTTKGTFAVKSVGQTVSADGKTITGTTDDNGMMTITFLGRPEDGHTAFTFPNPTTELGQVNFTASSSAYNTAPVAVAFGNSAVDQPVLVGPPSTIVFQAVSQPTYPTQPNEGMAVVFSKDTLQISAMVTDAVGQTVMTGTPIWFAQSWTKLADVGGTSDPDYNRKAVASANFSKDLTLTDGTGLASVGLSSNHSGVYTIRAFATKASKDTVAANLQVINTDATPGGLVLPAPTSVLNNLLVDGLGNTVNTAPLNVLCKTYAYNNRWELLAPATKARVNCNGNETATVTFKARDFDNKYVLPGTYYSASPMVADKIITEWRASGVLQDKNNNAVGYTSNGITYTVVQTFDEKSQASMLVRGSNGLTSIEGHLVDRTKVGEFTVSFDNQPTLDPAHPNSNQIYTYQGLGGGDADVVVFYGPDLEKIFEGGIAITPYTGVETDTRLQGYNLPAANPVIPTMDKLTVTLKDADENTFPPGIIVRIKGSAPEFNYSVKGQTDKDGSVTFDYPEQLNQMMTDLRNAGKDGVSDELTLTVTSETESSGYGLQTKSDFDQPSIITEQPHGGTLDPATDTVVVLPMNTAIPFSGTATSLLNGTLRDGYPINYYLDKDAVMTTASLSAAVGNLAGGTIPVFNFNTGDIYGKARVKTWYDKNNNGKFDEGSEKLADSGQFFVGLPTPQNVNINIPTGYDANGQGQLTVTWSDVPTDANYPSVDEGGYIVEYSPDGTNWYTKGNHTVYDAAKDATSYTLTGLTKGINYSVRVVAALFGAPAFNAGSVFSAPSTVATMYTNPPTPTGFSGSAVASDEIDLAWNTVVNAASYDIERLLVGSNTWVTVKYGATGNTYQDKNLLGITSYRYRIRAAIKEADANSTLVYSPWVESGNITTLSPLPSPTLFALVLDANNYIHLSWSQVTDNKGYKIQKSTDGTAYTDLTTTATDVNYLTDTAVEAGKTYYYHVASMDASNPVKLSGYSNPQSLSTTAAPDTPANFKSTGQTATSVSFSWDNVTNMQFIISRSDNGGLWYDDLPTIPAGTLTYTDTTVVAGTTYLYHIRAKVPSQTVFSAVSSDVTINM